MKTKFIKVTFVAAIAMIGAINVFNANNTETLSDTVMANVEALANPEIEIAFCIVADMKCKGQGMDDIKGYRHY